MLGRGVRSALNVRELQCALRAKEKSAQSIQRDLTEGPRHHQYKAVESRCDADRREHDSVRREQERPDAAGVDVGDVLTQLTLQEGLGVGTARHDARPAQGCVNHGVGRVVHRPLQYAPVRETLPQRRNPSMSMQNELNTITSTLNELSTRVTALVETEGAAMPPDIYSELVAAERTLGALLRRLNRVVGSFLDYARPHAGNPVPLDLNAAVRRTVQIPECRNPRVLCLRCLFQWAIRHSHKVK